MVQRLTGFRIHAHLADESLGSAVLQWPEGSVGATYGVLVSRDQQLGVLVEVSPHQHGGQTE
jgi:hypothetical protein